MKDGEKLSKWQQGLFRYCGLQTKCKSTVTCHMQEELTPCYKQGGHSLKICKIILSFYSALVKALAWMQTPGLGTTVHQQRCGPAGWISAGWICKTTTSEAEGRDELSMLKRRGRRKKSIITLSRYSNVWAQRERSNLSSVLGQNAKAPKLQISKAFPYFRVLN